MARSLSLMVVGWAIVASQTGAHAQRVTDGLITFYDFSEGAGTTVGDSGPGDALDLEINQADLDQGLVEWIAGSGLAMNLGTGTGQDGGALVRSAGAATKVYEAIAGGGGSNALTLEAWVTPELDDLMVNISRMFTMSGDSSNRNFTLGTTGDGRNYVNRLRNLTTGVNGSGGPGQLIGGEVRGGQRQHVVFTRDADGTETLYLDGEPTGGPREVAGNLSDNWDATYPVGIGNEITVDRKFNGIFHLAAIYGKALSEAEVKQNLAAGPAPERVTDGLVSLYDFAEGDGTTVFDTGPGDPLDLLIDQADLDQGLVEWIEGSGLAMNLGTGNGQDGGALVRSEDGATKIYDAIADFGGTNALTIEAWVTPELDDLMVNISRMITMSSDTTHRNFTFGTTGDGRDFVNRLRNPITGDNGVGGPGHLIGGAVRAGEKQHAVFTRDENGEERIYVDGELTAGPRVIAGNLSENWDPTYPFGIGNEITVDRKFNGIFHLVAIYEKALSEEEIQQNFSAGVGPGDCNDPPDTHCTGFTVVEDRSLDEVVEGGDYSAGVFTITPEGADDSGDVVRFTVIADNGVDSPKRITGEGDGPLTLVLQPAEWTLTVSVDDNILCDDVADDATCAPLSFTIGDCDTDRLLKWSEYGAGVQLWIPAESFTQRDPDTDEHYEVVCQDGAFGQAINRTGNGGGRLTYEFDLDVVDGLGGPWYFWGRVINPSNLSDYLLVEEDPDDLDIPEGAPYPQGDGAFPLDNGDDRIFEENVGGPPDAWAWGRSGHQEGHTKELVEGENTMHIFHRQGDRTVFWDVFMWTNDADYFPIDEDYIDAEEIDEEPPEPEGPLFVRGDANADGGFNISDGSFILNALFAGGPDPTCADAADANADGGVNIADGVYVLNSLFGGGAAPDAPHPGCGTAEIVIGCDSFAACP